MTGRLQPPHLDHFDLFRTVLARHDHLIVAVTNPDVGRRVADPRHPSRHLAASNPFTFDERRSFVAAALSEDGVAADRYSVVPFPLHSPEAVADLVPLSVTQYVRVYSEWEEAKVTMLADYGYPVVTLPGDAAARRDAAGVRAAIRSGGEWRHQVPPAVARLVTAALTARPMAER